MESLENVYINNIKPIEKITRAEMINNTFDQNPVLATDIYRTLGFTSSIELTDNQNKSGREMDLSQPIVFLNNILIDGNNRVKYAHENDLSLKRVDLNSWEDLEKNLDYLKQQDVGTIKNLIQEYNDMKKILDASPGEDVKIDFSPSLHYYQKRPEKNEEGEWVFEKFKEHTKNITFHRGKNLGHLDVVCVDSKREDFTKELYTRYIENGKFQNVDLALHMDAFKKIITEFKKDSDEKIKKLI